MIYNKEQFEKLMMLYLSETITDKEEQLLYEILNTDPKYKELYSEMLKTRAVSLIPVVESKKSTNYKQFIELFNKSILLARKPSFVQSFIRAAAIVVFILSTSISGFYIITNTNAKNEILTYETIVPHGSQSKIVLPDGTIAWLNSGSILKYHNNYGKRDRTVYLTGEGYFDVKKNDKKPFLVYASDIKVKVLGTVFNVRSYMNEANVEINLIEGKIDVRLNDNKIVSSLVLLPNEKVVYDKSKKTLKSYKANAARAASWTTGKLSFVDASIEEISKDLERRYDVKIKINTDRIKSELFSGSLDLNQPLDEVLSYLDVDKKYKRIYSGKSIIITDKN